MEQSLVSLGVRAGAADLDGPAEFCERLLESPDRNVGASDPFVSQRVARRQLANRANAGVGFGESPSQDASYGQSFVSPHFARAHFARGQLGDLSQAGKPPVPEFHPLRASVAHLRQGLIRLWPRRDYILDRPQGFFSTRTIHY